MVLKRLMRFSLLAAICFVLISCDDTPHYAPVMDISNIEPIPKSGVHRVKQGETLYEVAWRYGLDYRVIAKRNQMQSPYTLHSGQPIELRRTLSVAVKAPIRTRIHSTQTISVEPNTVVADWLWPAKGNIINSFSRLNKGINIAGRTGDAIYASAAGKVVYCGDGLRGYGNLIILKHNSLYLSAYAHNNMILVKEGDWVKQGQKIAEMGNTGSDKVMLHFEIRRAGKPVDPISLLKLA